MYDLMSWRARVGQFNNIKPKRSRKRHLYCKSDVTHCVTAICKFYRLLFSLYYINKPHRDLILPNHLPLILSSISLLLGPMWSIPTTSKKPTVPILAKFIIHYIFTYLPLLLILSGDIHPNPGPVNKNFSICHLNARSLTASNRVQEINASLVDIHSFDVIAVTETHLNASVENYKVELQSYQIQRRDRNRSGGGVAIYHRDHLPCSRRTDLEHNDIELLWVKLLISNKKHLIATCYRPPGQSRPQTQHFLSLFRASVELALQSNPHSLSILEDFNDRCSHWDSHHK